MIGYGTITKEHKGLKPDKSMCIGCRDDFYNGKNSYGVNECWHFKSARDVNKIGPRNMHSSGNDESREKTLSCFHN